LPALAAVVLGMKDLRDQAYPRRLLQCLLRDHQQLRPGAAPPVPV